MPQQIQEELAEDDILTIPVKSQGGYARVWDNSVGAVEVAEPTENAETEAEQPENKFIVVPYIQNDGSSLGFTVRDTSNGEIRDVAIPDAVAGNSE